MVSHGIDIVALGTQVYTPVQYQEHVHFDVDETLYCILDLETTGFSKDRNYIIEIACMICDDEGNILSDGSFCELVKPPTNIPQFITEITGITNSDVVGKEDFQTIGNDFLSFIIERMKQWEDENSSYCKHIVLVAHNGQRFDVPFLFKHFHHFQINKWLDIFNKLYILDTLMLAKHCVQLNNLPVPDNYKLSTLFNYCSNNELGDKAHRADVDVKATHQILIHKPFWNFRLDKIYKIDGFGKVDKRYTTQQSVVPIINTFSPIDDSDTDSSSSSDSSTTKSIDNINGENNISDDDNENDNDNCNENCNVNVNDDQTLQQEQVEQEQEDQIQVGWVKNKDFEGINATLLFENEITKIETRSTATYNTGLQCSCNSVNSPQKAWTSIFTSGILNKVVQYTNDYGII